LGVGLEHLEDECGGEAVAVALRIVLDDGHVRAIERLQGALHQAILAAHRDAFINAIHLYDSTGNWGWDCVFF
jgi:uncharacterized protein GlcG (DUF336 family)